MFIKFKGKAEYKTQVLKPSKLYFGSQSMSKYAPPPTLILEIYNVKIMEKIYFILPQGVQIKPVNNLRGNFVHQIEKNSLSAYFNEICFK